MFSEKKTLSRQVDLYYKLTPTPHSPPSCGNPTHPPGSDPRWDGPMIGSNLLALTNIIKNKPAGSSLADAGTQYIFIPLTLLILKD